MKRTRRRYGEVARDPDKVAAALKRETRRKKMVVHTTADIFRHHATKGYQANVCFSEAGGHDYSTRRRDPDEGAVGRTALRCGVATGKTPTGAYKAATLDLLRRIK